MHSWRYLRSTEAPSSIGLRDAHLTSPAQAPRRQAMRSGSGREAACQACLQRIEIVTREALLRDRVLGAVDDAAERGVLGPILRVPPKVLARDAHALRFAVERIEIVEVGQQDVAHLTRRRRGERVAGREVVRDLAEDPWPALRRAADHHRVGAGAREHLARLAWRIDVAVGEHRNAYRGLDRGDRLVFGLALV